MNVRYKARSCTRSVPEVFKEANRVDWKFLVRPEWTKV